MVGMNGFNVGVDAHIDPKPHATTLYVEWDRVNMTFHHSSGHGGERAWGGTMWASSPTFRLDCIPFNREG